ncbi:DUF5709 domain-containing protein [Streptomonospora litoralis]|uniref:DUF5709 domain-containing protein n=1 Tax=Streptomonospora litoralis TaxID=2498135 RepID=A0A4P6Q875_9ACTN|nr:DUF5709 domain-containing protein [Streptomonospora litoralis]QBI55244.1 hypothetical protein EKD16_17380 [Streptomonospora litoralis]
MSENHPEENEFPDDPVNETAADWEEAGLPAQEDTTEDQPLPGRVPTAIDESGSTGTEKESGEPLEESGEPLDDALAREQPDVPGALGSTARTADEFPPPGPEQETGGVRVVESDEGVREDAEDTMIARDAGVDRQAFSAEESAVHEEDESELS